VAHRAVTLAVFAAVTVGSLALIPIIGRDFFPYVDSGQMEFHVRPPAGTRSKGDGDVLVLLAAKHRPT
jgi:multidrug efflux pump subunit AcrB